MRRRGVVYDAGCVTGVTWRPDYSPALARRELEIVKTGLHCHGRRPGVPLARLQCLVQRGPGDLEVAGQWP